MGDVHDQILAELERRGPVGVPTLAESLDSHPITIDKHCYDLQADGYVYQTASGVYALADEGRAYLQSLDP